MTRTAPYRGRFAPSPTGPLHAGSLVAALASWLDARAHDGLWLVRIEDVDAPRCVKGADQFILSQLARCGLMPDEPPIWQSTRSEGYASALSALVATGQAYPCTCTRQRIEQAWAVQGRPRQRHGERIYPGTCRQPRAAHHDARPDAGSSKVAWRLRTDGNEGQDVVVDWFDRRLGARGQNLTRSVGDFILRRSDGLWAYQLAVVVDDAVQGITDVVRGEDLADNTPRQIHLQRGLQLPTPRYLHTPLALDAQGEKLSKSDGAARLDTAMPLTALAAAAQVLGLTVPDAATVPEWLAGAVRCWADQIDRKCSR